MTGWSRTLEVLLSAAAVALATAGRVVAAPSSGVGRAASTAEVAERDITVFPSGAGLPAGRGTAVEGKRLYAALCAVCHGEHGEGRADYPPLVGGRGTISQPNPNLTVGSYWPYATTIWDYINRAMPYVAPGTLSADQVYAVTAFLLYANGIVRSDAIMDARALPTVTMPNRDGFVGDPRPDVGPGSRGESRRGRAVVRSR